MGAIKEARAARERSYSWSADREPMHSKPHFLFSTPRASKLSKELRSRAEGSLPERRAIVTLSLIAIGAMSAISLYQMGVIRHLPEPPFPKLDADRIDASDEAYKRFSTPDAVMGIGSYAATMALAEMGGKDRALKQPWIPLAMAGKVAFDVGQSLRMIATQWNKFGAFCFYCLISAAATFGTAALTVKEAREAACELTRRARSR